VTISDRPAANPESSPDCVFEGHETQAHALAWLRSYPLGKEETVMSIITSSPNKATALARVQALMAGTEKHFPNGSFTLGNTTYTTASLVQALKSLEDALAAVDAAQSGARDAVSALRATEATLAPLLRDYRSFLRATFSTAASQLADFGLPPIKARKPLSSEERATATAKMRATRVARGTRSKKQKLAVKGNVTGVVVTPVTNTGPSSPTATPAEPAPAAPAAGPASGATAASGALK
jgi:hypothetical protein